MALMGDLSAFIRLSKKHNGRPRCVPVWIGRTGSSARIRPGLWARRGRSAATRRTARMWVRLTDRDLAASTLNQTRAIVQASSRSQWSATTSRRTYRSRSSAPRRMGRPRRRSASTRPRRSCASSRTPSTIKTQRCSWTAAFTGLRASELRGLRWALDRLRWLAPARRARVHRRRRRGPP